jgi:hypothetical protein
MVYRKSPLRPPRLLLRIAATAGAGAMLSVGVAACGSSAGVDGVAALPPEDSGADHMDGDGAAPCETGCGIVVSPEGGDAEMVGGGVMVNPEAGADVVTGVIAMPDGGTD